MKRGQLPTNQEPGFSLIEVILASSVFVLLATTLVGSYLYGQESTALAGSRARAILLAEEGLEVVRNMRDENVANIIDGTHGLSLSGNQWVLSGSNDVTGIFNRSITISSVDADRKEISSHVTWQQNAQRAGSVSLMSRLSFWVNTVMGDWSSPQISTTTNLSNNDDGRKISISGDYVFIIKNGGTPDFVVLDISNPLAPAQVGSLSLAGTPVNITISGNYAYITSNDNSAELLIVDISDPTSPTLAGTYNASGNTDGSGVFVVGTTAYLGRTDNAGTDEFSIIDVSNPALPTLVGTLNSSGSASELVVMGNYAYIASGNNSQELQVVNISNPALPTLAGSLNLSGNTDALTIAGFGSTVVLGQGTTLYVVNVATPASPSVTGSIDTGGTVNDVDLGNANNYVFTANANNNSEFQVISISTPSLPVQLGSLNLAADPDLFGIVYDSITDKAYAVSNANTQEVFVFSPQ